MTEPDRSESDATPSDPTTDAEFHAALGRLLRRAEANGVDVEGGWSFRSDDDHVGWGVEIYAVVRDPGGTTGNGRMSSSG